MKVLVTGGAGYIGSHTCKGLAQAGHHPVTFDNLIYGHESAVKWGPLEKGSLAETEKLTALMKLHKIEAVLHFAAYAYVGESVTRPELYYENNVSGTLSLLNAMRAAQVKTIVFSSTCATYGDPVRIPIDESHPQNPVNPYGNTKLVVEKMLHDFGKAHDLGSVCLRYFNAAGADIDGDIGEAHDPETHLIPLAIRAASGKLDKLTVFGNDYATPDGTCVRDYIHVTDLATAHVLALELLTAGKAAAAYNLGNGQGFSVSEVIAAVEKISGRKISVIMGPRRNGDPPQLIADSSKAKRELGWKPKFFQIETMVKSAWDWEMDRSLKT